MYSDKAQNIQRLVAKPTTLHLEEHRCSGLGHREDLVPEELQPGHQRLAAFPNSTFEWIGHDGSFGCITTNCPAASFGSTVFPLIEGQVCYKLVDGGCRSREWQGNK